MTAEGPRRRLGRGSVGLVGLVPVMCLLLQGCLGAGCTAVGGDDVIVLTIPRAVYAGEGSVSLEVCDADGCASMTESLAQMSNSERERSLYVTFADLGRRYEPGIVTADVQVRDAAGKTVVATRRDLELTRSYPNGRFCDGDGYVNGYLTLTIADRT